MGSEIFVGTPCRPGTIPSLGRGTSAIPALKDLGSGGAFWMTHGGRAMAVALWHARFLKREQQPGYTWTYIIIHLILKTVLTPFEKNINHQYPSTQKGRHNRGPCMSNPSRMPR